MIITEANKGDLCASCGHTRRVHTRGVGTECRFAPSRGSGGPLEVCSCCTFEEPAERAAEALCDIGPFQCDLVNGHPGSCRGDGGPRRDRKPRSTSSTRPDWDEYFMIIADAVSLRMSCDRARIGAVIVSPDHRILATGYGGAPSGLPSCDEVGHQLMTINGRESCVRTVHAETNAVIFAARHGVRIDGATLYTTASTCADCARAMLQAGIARIVYAAEYTSARSGGEDILAMLRAAGVEVNHVPLTNRMTWGPR